MKKIEKYYDNTETDLPHKNVKKFIEIESNAGKAIELGCGAGRDTVYLIKNKWNVLAIDRENVEDRFYELWDKINKSILPNRIFCREFFWNKR